MISWLSSAGPTGIQNQDTSTLSLLYLALAYLWGIAFGRWLWHVGLLNCDAPGWLWFVCLLPVPGLLWWDRFRKAPSVLPMYWPISAGFEPIRPTVTGPLLGAVVLCAGAGALRFASHPLEPCWDRDDLAFYNAAATGSQNATVTLTGVVVNYPSIRNGRQRLLLHVDSVQIDGQPRPVKGMAELSVFPRPLFTYGQLLRVSGALVEPPNVEAFDYRAYLARKGVHSLIRRPVIHTLPGQNAGNPVTEVLYSLRRKGEQFVSRSLHEPYAALANGMLLGVETGIPDDLYEQFNLTGSSHVIVISGSNIAVVAGVLMAMTVPLLGRRRSMWATLIGVAFYVLLVGGDPAVTRAGIMGGLFVVAITLGRRSTALVSLAAASWAMTLLDPLTLWDVGFQFSAAGTLGLIFITPFLASGQGRRHAEEPLTLLDTLRLTGVRLAGRVIREILLLTLAASLATLPLIAFYFDRVSLSPLTNLLIAPVQPFIMIWGGAGLILGMAGLEFVARALMWVSHLSLAWTVSMVQWTAGLPGASVTLSDYGPGGLILTYVALAVIRWWKQVAMWSMQVWRRFSSQGDASQTAASLSDAAGSPFWGHTANGLLTGMTVALVLLWRVMLTRPDGYLHVHFLDVGQGDGIFIQTPSGRQVLVDGGANAQVLLGELGRVLPFWDRTIDLLLLSHADMDHMGAQLNLPERYRIEQAVISPATRADENGTEWVDVMSAAGVPVSIQAAGGWIDLGDGVALWSLWPPPSGEETASGGDENEQSLVAMLVYGDLRLLLTGDAGLPAERALLRAAAPLGAQVLKVGHHGSESSTGSDFVAAVNPSVAVIQVGENPYGHPHPAVLDVLAGRLVLRNDEHGWVHLRSDGTQMWLDAEQRLSLEVLE